MLTSAARETLAEVQTVIVDEVHAVAAHQARRPSRALPGAPRPAAGDARAAHRPVGDGPARRGGRPVPVRSRRPTTIVAPKRPRRSTCRCRCPCPTWPTSSNNSIWPDVEERIVDLIEAHNATRSCSPTHGGWPNDSPPGSTRSTPNARESNCSDEPNPKVGGGSPAHIMGSGQTFGARAAAGEGAPRLGQQGAARPGRGRPQERAAQGRRRHLEPGTGHRHGRGRPGDPGRGAAVGGQRAAAHRSRRPPGRRDLARRAVPQAPHRPDRLRGHRAAHARRRRSRP